MTLFFAAAVCELGIKGLNVAVKREKAGSERPAETPRTRKGNHGSDRAERGKRERERAVANVQSIM